MTARSLRASEAAERSASIDHLSWTLLYPVYARPRADGWQPNVAHSSGTACFPEYRVRPPRSTPQNCTDRGVRRRTPGPCWPRPSQSWPTLRIPFCLLSGHLKGPTTLVEHEQGGCPIHAGPAMGQACSQLLCPARLTSPPLPGAHSPRDQSATEASKRAPMWRINRVAGGGKGKRRRRVLARPSVLHLPGPGRPVLRGCPHRRRLSPARRDGLGDRGGAARGEVATPGSP
jgi:hypothetical protein